MPFDSEDAFIPDDPAQWPRFGGVPRIVVRPLPPPGNPVSDVSGAAFDDGPDDWFVPPSSVTPNTWPGAQPGASAGGGSSNPPPGWPDPWAAFWSRIPASSAGAMAWQPPIFLGDPSTLPPASGAPSWPSALTPPAGIPNFPTSGGIPGGSAQVGSPNPTIRLGSMFDSLAELGSPGPIIGGMFPSLAKLGLPGSTLAPGTMFDSLAALGSSSPNPGGAFPPPPQAQFADLQPGSPPARRPLADYSTGEILGDAAKSTGVGVGRFGIQAAGARGDVREMIANGAQRVADYFTSGSAPNAGANVSDYLAASFPSMAGPTSSQLQSAIESYTGPFYQPKTIIGDYAQTAGEFVPGALLTPGGSLAANAVRYSLLPALTSETAGQLTKGTAAEPWARALGAILGTGPSAWRDLVGPRSAPALAKPLAESELSPADQLAARRRAQLEVNKASGAAFEKSTAAELSQQEDIEFVGQITVQLPSGVRARLDFVTRNRVTGEIRVIECKSSATAPLTPNQEAAFREMEQQEATIMGEGKPGFPGGMKISPTKVEIRRPGS
jgi:hypothetical protein